MTRLALLLALCAAAACEEYEGFLGRWVEVTATAYSPHDKRDSRYHATKGKDRWMTAGRVSDVRKVPYGIAAPQPGRRGDRPALPSNLTIPLRTRIIVPVESGYQTRPEQSPASRVFTVDDTGGDITEDTRRTGRIHIDLRVRTEAEAFNYNHGAGRHRFKVFIISGTAPPKPQRAVAVPVAVPPQPAVTAPRPWPAAAARAPAPPKPVAPPAVRSYSIDGPVIAVLVLLLAVTLWVVIRTVLHRRPW